MEIRRGKLITITTYIVSMIVYVIAAIVIYHSLIKLHYFYLFATIPLLFLLFFLICFNFIKIVLLSISLIFDKNDNTEIESVIDKKLKDTNRIFKYVLIGIFITLLTSIMILDVSVCIVKAHYELAAISIVVWVLLYYLLFIQIVKMIKREIRL